MDDFAASEFDVDRFTRCFIFDEVDLFSLLLRRIPATRLDTAHVISALLAGVDIVLLEAVQELGCDLREACFPEWRYEQSWHFFAFSILVSL